MNDLLKNHTNLNTEILSFTDNTVCLLSERTMNTLYYKANITLSNIYI